MTTQAKRYLWTETSPKGFKFYLSIDPKWGVTRHHSHHLAKVYELDSIEGKILEEYRRLTPDNVSKRVSYRKHDVSLSHINVKLNSALGAAAMMGAQAARLRSISHDLLHYNELDTINAIIARVNSRVSRSREILGIQSPKDYRDE